MEHTMIHLEQVSKIYGEGPTSVHALDTVSFDVDAGQFVSVMGTSGSGKSTLLNLVSALDVPTSGKVVLAGQDISTLSDDALTLFRRRTVGLVFQFFNLLPALNALDNTLLPVMLDRKVNAADEERASMLLEEVGLGGRKLHFVNQLSGGEMQRVAIARALMLEPRIILADEPTGSLDSHTGQAVLRLLRRCCDHHDATVMMVTHDLKAAEVGDRLLVLKDGKLVDDRAMSEVTGTRSLGPLGAAS
jgi:putative ABC transport system ATP-binding protein